MSKLLLQGYPVTVIAAIDVKYSPRTDYLLVSFGTVSMGLYSSSERKAFIAALQEADAELDVAALRAEKEQVAA